MVLTESIKDQADKIIYIDDIKELKTKLNFENMRLKLATASIKKLKVYMYTDYMNIKHLVILL